jgi:hypothetical protein
MSRTATWILATATAVAALGATAIAQDKKGGCVMAGGEATMITSDLAKFMANAALKNSISGMGAKASGEVKMDCKESFASVYCIAKQRACK